MKRILISLAMMVFFTTVAVSQTLPDEVIVSYTCANKSLTTVLDELTNRSKVNIIYSAKRLPKRKKVTIQANNEQLGVVLTVILSDFGYKYKIVGNQLVIVKDDLEDVEELITINGYVQDSVSGERLVYANIFLLDKTQGTESNEYGYFSFTLPKGDQRVYFSYLGFKERVVNFRLKQDSTVIIDMAPDVQLNEIVILDADEVEADQNTSSENRMNFDDLQSMTSLGGEADVVRLANILPGVSSGADGFGGLNVRGGSADQNLVLFDGIPVYNAGHALGIFSIFNSNVIKSATLIKGGFPARYGGRLSSVLDVRTREGNSKKMEGAVSISAIAMKASIEGPIGSNGSSYLFSARRTFVDRWIRSITSFNYRSNGNDDVGFSNYFFYDLNGKLNFKLGDKHQLLISAYNGKDDFENEVDRIRLDGELRERTESNFRWANKLATVRLNSQLSKKLFSKLAVYISDYNFSSYDYDRFEKDINPATTEFNYKASSYLSQITDKGAKLDLDYIYSPSHFLKFGGGVVQHSFNPGLINLNNINDPIEITQAVIQREVENRIESPNLVGNEIFGYVEDQMSFGYGFMLNLGVHTSRITSDNNTYINWQPRLALMLRGEAIYFKASASKMNQYLHLISNNGIGLPSEIWLPSTDRLRPQSSWIYSSTLAYHSKDTGFHFGGEAFYKTFNDLSAFNEGTPVAINQGTDWENLIPLGGGDAYGLEFFVDKVAGRTTWKANYTYTKSRRQFDELNNAEEFLHRFSLDHNLKLSLRHRLTADAEFSLNYHMSSGSRVTTPSGDIVPGPNGEILIEYNATNNEVLPSYQRLDIGFNFYNKYKWGRQKISIGAYNILDKRNPFYVDIQRSRSNSSKFELVRFTILPVFPAISYSLSF